MRATRPGLAGQLELLGARRRGVDLEPEGGAQVDGREAHPATGPEHQHALPGGGRDPTAEGEPAGEVALHERGRLTVAQGVGEGDAAVGAGHGLAHVAADAGAGEDALADRPSGHVLADLGDAAHDLHAGHERRRDLDLVEALHHQPLHVVHAAGGDLDPHVVGAERRRGPLLHDELVDRSPFLAHDGTHGRSVGRRRIGRPPAAGPGNMHPRARTTGAPAQGEDNDRLGPHRRARAAREAHHHEPAGEAQRAEPPAARRDPRGALRGRPDDDVHVQIIRGAGPSFSAGYDLGDGNEGHEYPFYTPGGDGQWPRHVTEGWMGIWDLAKPVIAQVHGYCLAGGSELATGCDLVVHGRGRADGLPGGALRRARHALPRLVPRHAPGDGDDGHRRLDQRHRGRGRGLGQQARSRPTSSTSETVEVRRSASPPLPPEVVQLNKRVVHRQMDYMGMRTGIRAGTELCALGTHTKAMADFVGNTQGEGPHRRPHRARRQVRRLPHQLTRSDRSRSRRTFVLVAFPVAGDVNA